ncbi:sulfate transporter [Streptomyces mashuensis]|uniref:Sulfate transporter n=1 Tax=Streptomyces mashuensis TaxID=33904 RepID=A0A919B9D7_9ACTN|nr:SulP family inorganic anion transporter [Streptomyces mashuensis]GHF75874.1 sulfate transporter [Streptomyces mashuensis]
MQKPPQPSPFRRVRKVPPRIRTRIRARTRTRATLRADFAASLVVFLLAVPLSAGVAAASGVPVELGLVAGIVGGLLTGLLPGSSLQVSGPAAGLTVLVYEAVREYGLQALGVLVLTAGLMQVAMGALGLGRWFRALSVAVVQGMLAGIGIVLIAGQLYALADADVPDGGLAKLGGLVTLMTHTVTSTDALLAMAVGAGTVVVLALWHRFPRTALIVPAPLAAVAVATAATTALRLPVDRIRVRGVLDAIQPPGSGAFARLTEFGVLGTVFTLALVASAEAVCAATTTDRLPTDRLPTGRLPTGRGTGTGYGHRYSKELIAQGASAPTRASRVLHAVWLLAFATVLPWGLELVPVAALAGVLVHTGWTLLPAAELGPLWRDHRGEAAVLATTAGAVVATNLFEGVLVGLLTAVAKTAWDTSQVTVETTRRADGVVHARVLGHATFLRLPRLLDELDAFARKGYRVQLDLDGLRHIDRACLTALTAWSERQARHWAASDGGENGEGEATGRVAVA